MFLKSLKYLHKRDDLLFYIDSRAYSFLVRAWIADSVADPFDFLLAGCMYNDMLRKTIIINVTVASSCRTSTATFQLISNRKSRVNGA